MKYGTLYLIPNTLGITAQIEAALPSQTQQIAQRLNIYIGENAKDTRYFLKKIGTPYPIQEIQISELNVHTTEVQRRELLQPLLDGHDVGLVSDAGCPAIADPGALLVRLAHEHQIRVVPLVGPSSILLGLMASGLNGQQFAFHGYLPIEQEARAKKIKALELESIRHQQTQIFIETPYRNQKLLNSLKDLCANSSLLCVAVDLSLPTEQIQSLSIQQWKTIDAFEFNKRPTIFLLLGQKKSSQ